MMGIDWIREVQPVASIWPPLGRCLFRQVSIPTPRVEDVMIGRDVFSKWAFPDDVVILADNALRSNLDSIFPPHPESLFLAEIIGPPVGSGRFADIGVGSGLLSVRAALKGWSVRGVDVNARALAVSELNATLNGVEIDVVRHDATEPWPYDPVALCIANLPFEFTPAGCRNFLHSEGGKYGDSVLVPFLGCVDSILEVGGVAVVPAFSLLKEDCSRLQLHLESNSCPSLNSLIVRLSEPIDIESVFGRYRNKQQKESAAADLRKEGYGSFAIEIAVLKKPSSVRSGHKGVFRFAVADRQWIAPAGVRRLANPTS